MRGIKMVFALCAVALAAPFDATSLSAQQATSQRPAKVAVAQQATASATSQSATNKDKKDAAKAEVDKKAKSGEAAKKPPKKGEATQPKSVVPPPSAAVIAGWIEELGDDQFVKRKQAREHLSRVGLAARAHLLAGLRHRDAEVRRSCRRILGDVLAADFQRKVTAFQADEQGTGQHDLPGWQRFREMVGNSTDARATFLKMLKAEEGLLASLEASDEVVGQALKTRFNQVWMRAYQGPSRQRKQPSYGTLATLMFIAGDENRELPTDVVNNSYWVSMLQHPNFKQQFDRNSKDNVARVLLGQWLLRPTSTSLVYQKLRLILTYRLPEGLKVSEQAMKNKRLSPSYRAYAMGALGQLGGKKYAAKMLEMLDDKTVCTIRTIRVNNVQHRMNVEMRDVALGWLIHLTGQDVTQYGMPAAKSAFSRATRTRTYMMSASYFYFNKPGQREIALKKWQEWAKKNKLPPIPKEPVLTAAPPTPNVRGPATRFGGFNGVPPIGIPNIQIQQRVVPAKKAVKKVRPKADEPAKKAEPVKKKIESAKKAPAARAALRGVNKNQAAQKINRRALPVQPRLQRAVRPRAPAVQRRGAPPKATTKPATTKPATTKPATADPATDKPSAKKETQQLRAAGQAAKRAAAIGKAKAQAQALKDRIEAEQAARAQIEEAVLAAQVAAAQAAQRKAALKRAQVKALFPQQGEKKAPANVKKAQAGGAEQMAEMFAPGGNILGLVMNALPQKQAVVQQRAQQQAAIQIQGGIIQLKAQGGKIIIGPDGRVIEQPDKTKKAGLHLPIADGDMTRRLRRALKAIDQDNIADAVILLGSILAEEKDYVFKERHEVALSRGLKAEALKQLGQLPARGRRIYELHFGSDARVLLNRALVSGKIDELSRISRCFFYTEAGAEATYLVAEYFMNRNRPLRAALYFERLQSSSHAMSPFEPVLSFKLATCWIRADMHDRAREVLIKLRDSHPDASLRVAGELHRMFAKNDDALKWLTGFIGPHPQRSLAEGWLMYRGSPTRNAAGDDGVPYLAGRRLWSESNKSPLQPIIDSIQKTNLQQHRALLPSAQPLIVNGTIVMRSPTHIAAVDAKSGELKWEAAFNDALRYYEQYQAGKEGDTAQASYVRDGLEQRLWQNPTFGTMSSDGRMVFGIENLAFGATDFNQRMVVMPDGKRALDPGINKTYNLLTAYDVKTGKVRWEVGGPQCNAELPLAGTYFLGPPLPFGGRLYVVARSGDLTKLMELSSENGKLLWQLALADKSIDPTGPYIHPMYRQAMKKTRSGAGPSLADGVLVCPTSDNDYVAVDLATRSILWMYQTTPHEEAGQMGMNRMVFMMPFNNAAQASGSQNHRNVGWSDPSVTISQGRVLITPSRSNKLYCLDLRSGELQWVAPREDGFYVGGVQDSKVIVVGRSGLSARKLDTGTMAWAAGKSEFSPGAVPTGRGFFGQKRYYVPLSTSEVVAYEVATGRFVARTRAGESFVPGNIVAHGDTIISQGPKGVFQLSRLSKRQKDLRATLAKNPNDLDAMAALGETLAYDGKLEEAVKLLRAVLVKRPDDVASQKALAEAIVDGLKTDHKRFVDLARDVEPIIKSAQSQSGYLSQLVHVYERSGNHLAAFRTCLKLLEIEPESPKMKYVGAAHLVRSDWWVRSQLLRLVSGAQGDARVAMDKQIVELLAKDAKRYGPYFDFHLATAELQLTRAKALMGTKEWGPAEHELLAIIRRGKPEHVRQATAMLAEVYAKAGKWAHAHLVCDHLQAEFGDLICRDGKSGKQVVARLMATNDKLKKAMGAKWQWPKGVVKATSTNAYTRTSYSAYSYPMSVNSVGSPYNAGMDAQVDSRGQVVYLMDRMGQHLWRADMQNPKFRMPYAGPNYEKIRGTLSGHLLVTWLGGRVCAIDGMKGATLWKKEMGAPAGYGQLGFVRFGGIRGVPAVAEAERIPMLALSQIVIYQLNKDLVAVDSWTGKELWKRTDVPEKSDLFGDDEHVLVTPSDSTQAFVLRVADGQLVGQRTLTSRNRRLAVLGNKQLTWDSTGKEMELVLEDVLAGKPAWKKAFHKEAKVWLANEQEAAVYEPTGKFTIVDIKSGKKRLETDVASKEKIDSMFALRLDDMYVLILNDTVDYPVSSPALYGVPVNGLVVGISAKDGKIVWKRDVKRQRMRIDHTPGVPALAFVCYIYQRVNNTSRREFNVLCLDRRNGKTLYSNTSSSSDNLMRIYAEPANRKMFVQMRRRRVELQFTDEPAPKTPVTPKTPGTTKPNSKSPKKEAPKTEGASDLSIFRQRVQGGLKR